MYLYMYMYLSLSLIKPGEKYYLCTTSTRIICCCFFLLFISNSFLLEKIYMWFYCFLSIIIEAFSFLVYYLYRNFLPGDDEKIQNMKMYTVSDNDNTYLDWLMVVVDCFVFKLSRISSQWLYDTKIRHTQTNT